MPWPLITRQQLESRISAKAVQRIYDDSNVGAPDSDAVAQLLSDASAKLATHLAPVYPIDTMTAWSDAEIPHDIRRMCLDIAQAMGAIRHPEVVRMDGLELMKAVERDMKQVRENGTDLGGGDPDPDPDDDSATGIAAIASACSRGRIFP